MIKWLQRNGTGDECTQPAHPCLAVVLLSRGGLALSQWFCSPVVLQTGRATGSPFAAGATCKGLAPSAALARPCPAVGASAPVRGAGRRIIMSRGSSRRLTLRLARVIGVKDAAARRQPVLAPYQTPSPQRKKANTRAITRTMYRQASGVSASFEQTASSRQASLWTSSWALPRPPAARPPS